MDDAQHLVRNVRHAVVPDQAQATGFAARLRLQDGQPLADALDLQADHHHRRLFHAFRPFVGLAQVQRREVQDRRFLVDRAAIGENRLGRKLQLHVVVEAERLQQAYQRVERGAGRIDPLLGTRVGRHDDRQAVILGHGVEHGDQLGEGTLGLDVFLAVGADHEIALGLQFEALQHVGSLDARPVVVQHLEHRAAGLDHLVGR